MNTTNTTNTMNITTTNTMYDTKDIAKAARCPGGEVGKIITDKGVQPLHVRVTETNKHYYKWGQDAMDVALAWRLEQDKRVAAKKAKRIAKMPKVAPVQLPLPLPQPEVTETFPTIERRKDDAQLIAIHEQLITLNNTMASLLAYWTKE